MLTNALQIKQQLQTAPDWQSRFRLLIQASRFLPILTEEERSHLAEISGCEARLWWGKSSTNPQQFQAYSEARIMNGILFLLLAELSTLDKEEIISFSMEDFFKELKIFDHLSQSRRFGLKEIEKRLHANA